MDDTTKPRGLRIGNTMLRKVSAGLWVSPSGTLTVSQWPVKRNPWHARWTDLLGGEHQLEAQTLGELRRELRPYID